MGNTEINENDFANLNLSDTDGNDNLNVRGKNFLNIFVVLANNYFFKLFKVDDYKKKQKYEKKTLISKFLQIIALKFGFK